MTSFTHENLLELMKTEAGMLVLNGTVALLAGWYNRKEHDAAGRARFCLCRPDGSMHNWVRPEERNLLPLLLPSFISSRDAMAEAEKTLTDREWERYLPALTHPSAPSIAGCYSAPAVRRAIAFILTKQEGTK